MSINCRVNELISAREVTVTSLLKSIRLFLQHRPQYFADSLTRASTGLSRLTSYDLGIEGGYKLAGCNVPVI